MIFEENERVALARIMSDLIESDFVVEEGEMDSFKALVESKELKTSVNMRSEAKRLTLAKAVGVLQRIDDEKKEFVMKELYRMSLSDGSCVPLEATQLMAVDYALKGNGQLFSIPAGDNFIENMKVVYIEHSDETDADRYICEHYKAIANEFSLAGFEFVYIPRIAKDFSDIGVEYLRKVISFMMPLISESKMDSVVHELCSMTTSRFTRQLLFKKMGIDVLGNNPAFLFKIGESYVADYSVTDDAERNVYSNYLLIPIDNVENGSSDLLDQIAGFTDLYRSMVSGNIVTETRNLSGKFIYSGFHRSLFDLIAYGKEKEEYKLVINLSNKNNPVFLRPLGKDCDSDDDAPLDITPQPYALFILMVYMSLLDCHAGLDWKDYEFSNPIKREILRKYNAIYCGIGKGNKSLEYRDKSHVSRIKKAIKGHEKIVTNINLFIPEKISKGDKEFYYVPVSPDLVYVIEDGKEVRMVDSVFWKDL